ncbi:MAG: fatty acid desaturase [Ilumatobacteraceae bacterium]
MDLSTTYAIIPASCYERRPGKPSSPRPGLAAVAGPGRRPPHRRRLVVLRAGRARRTGRGRPVRPGPRRLARRPVRVERQQGATARWCMLPSLHNEAAWDLGHNRIHHGFTTRIGFDFVWHPSTPEEFAAMSRFHRLRHRLEWSWLGSGAYYFRSVWWEKMMRYTPEGKRGAAYVKDNRVMFARFAVLVAAMATVGALQGGVFRALWLVAATLIIPFLMFCHVIGWTVYVHHVDPSVKWWPRRDWNQFKGQMESTTILEFPSIIDNLWFHHIFVHTPHHVDMRIPFHQLPAAARAIEQHYPGIVRHERWNPRQYFQATKACKLYDVERMTWVRYDAA